MRKSAAGVILFATSLGFSQTPPKDHDALQSLLDEVHGLRQAIEGMTAASQRVQIALYGLQMQDSAVARAAERFEQLRNQCSAIDGARQHIAEEVRRMESGLSSGTISEGDSKEFKARLPGLKSELELQTASVQNCHVAEADASSQLRNGQAKLLELQERITRLDKALEQLGSKGK